MHRLVISFGRREPLAWRSRRVAMLAFIFSALAFPALAAPNPPQSKSDIDEINTEFHFLGEDDTLLIHEEEGRIKGQIDIYQGEEESDSVLSYNLTIGTRKGDHVEFKTSKIHQRYYRFSGDVVRGSGREDKDADFLRLVGELQIITVNPESGNESVEKKQVALKSLSASEISDD